MTWLGLGPLICDMMSPIEAIASIDEIRDLTWKHLLSHNEDQVVKEWKTLSAIMG